MSSILKSYGVILNYFVPSLGDWACIILHRLITSQFGCFRCSVAVHIWQRATVLNNTGLERSVKWKEGLGAEHWGNLRFNFTVHEEENELALLNHLRILSPSISSFLPQEVGERNYEGRFNSHLKKKKKKKKSSCCGSVETNPTSVCWDTGSIPGLTEWVKDLALLQAVV